MANKPSDKRRKTDGGVAMNLMPIMNLMLLLIPALLMSQAMLQIAVINVSAPRIGGSDSTPTEKPEKPPLNLTVAISDKGFYISGRGATLGAEAGGEGDAAADNAGPTIPKNDKGEYDFESLTKKMVEIKDNFPEETRINLTSEPDTRYEVLIEVMDATRRTGEGRELFPEVVLAGLS